MLLKLHYYGDPVLRQKCEPIEKIDDELRRLVDDMIETMRHNGRGMGLSATQVGFLGRLFITMAPILQPDGNYHYKDVRVYINPVFSDPSEELIAIDEGCMSIPGVRGVVERPLEITCNWTDLNGVEHQERLTEWEARIAMHEMDHLNGVLYIDRMRGKARRVLDQRLNELKRHTLEQMKAEGREV
jgi:peptide deformylase